MSLVRDTKVTPMSWVIKVTNGLPVELKTFHFLIIVKQRLQFPLTVSRAPEACTFLNTIFYTFA